MKKCSNIQVCEYCLSDIDIFHSDRRMRIYSDPVTGNARFLCPVCGSEARLTVPTSIPHHGVLKENIVPDEFLRPEQAAFEPPVFAEFLLTLLATTRRAEAMFGDLNELFTNECVKYGRKRAVRLYWARALRSLPPLLWRAIGKVVVGMVKRFFDLSGA